MSLETEAQAAGERRHETCEHGMLTPSFRVDLLGNETPGLAPLCLWRIPEPCPPAIKRAWGGLVDFARDCALCEAYQRPEARNDDAS